MKYIVAIIFLISWNGQAQIADVPVITKTPKSLFLIKKAKIDNDVGEPVLYPGQKQVELLSNEKIFNKYRLQILDTQ